jgi:hypothetical protein
MQVGGSGGPLRFELTLVSSRMRRNNGEPATRHAQQYGRTMGITAGRKPTDVVGRAMFTVQHGFFRKGDTSRQPSRMRRGRSSHMEIPFKAMDVPAGPNVADHLLPVHDETLERYNWALIGIEAATKSHGR